MTAQINLNSLSDDALAKFFQDEDGVLARRLEHILRDQSRKIGTAPAGFQTGEEGAKQKSAYLMPSASPAQLSGLYFAVLRKGAGHNDPCWGRISTQVNGRNYGYTHRQQVGDLFAKGTNRVGLEIWCPFYVSPTGVSYHTYVELWADPSVWRPGGVIAWAEAWGVLRFENEHKLYGYDFTLTLE